MTIEGLYAIVDRSHSLKKNEDNLASLAEDYLKGGVTILQLRDKERHRDPKQFFKTAQAIQSLKKKYSFLFIVNDEPAIAREIGADGVHVGADDPSIASCRKTLGENAVIGYSAHSLIEAKRAEAEGADYVAFGAIYPTPTKGPGHPVQGLSRLCDMVSTLRVPVVAIGGIGRNNVADVWATGVASVAMISALAKAADRVAEVRYFSKLFAERSQ